MLPQFSKIISLEVCKKIPQLFPAFCYYSSRSSSQNNKVVGRQEVAKLKPVGRIEVTKSQKPVWGGLISREEAHQREWNRETFRRLDKDTIREFQDPDNVFEPHPEMFGREYYDYKRDRIREREKRRRQRTIRRHFKEYNPKELSFLTWAEKETIRHLNSKEPELWSPRVISDSFPISEEGALKIIKSSFRLKKPEDIMQHDQDVRDRIQQVKEGKIPVTPQIQRNLSIREKVPFTVGAMPPQTKEVALPAQVKPLGEFARLVASPEKLKEALRLAEEAERAWKEAEERQIKKEKKYKEELTNLKIKSHHKLTLSQFEEKLKGKLPQHKQISGAERLTDVAPEVNYLVNLKPSVIPRAKAFDSELEQEDRGPSAKSYLESYNVKKFKNPDESENESLPNTKEFDDDQQLKPTVSYDEEKGYYIFDEKKGYQKPFGASDNLPDRIEIPDSVRVPGGMYRLGKAFYDENGEFLYKVF